MSQLQPGRPARKKLCFAIWGLGVGGAERFFIALAKAVPRDRYDVSILCLKEKGLYSRELEEAGIPVHCIEKARAVDFAAFFRLLRFLRRERPDLLNTFLWTADFWGRIAGILTGVPAMVVTEQNVDLWKSPCRRFIDRLLFFFTAQSICVGEEVRKFYVQEVGYPPEKVVVIPNAVDLKDFSRAAAGGGRIREECDIGESDFVFVCAARLHPQKAHAVMLEAMSLLRLRAPSPCRLLLVGDGSERQPLEALTDRLGLRREVIFLGARTDVPAILRDADAFVLSSDYEGLSLAILEAMASALSVVAVAAGANSTVIEDGRTGFIVPPRDPRLLAESMGRLVENRVVAKAMGREGRAVVQARYGIESAARATLELFDRLLARHERQPR